MSIVKLKALHYLPRRRILRSILILSLLLCLTLYHLFQNHNPPNTDPYYINYKLTKNDDHQSGKLSHQQISSLNDAPFQHGCTIPSTSSPRANAAFVMLCRNTDLEAVIQSITSMERHFNQWFNYPWVFLNNDDFTSEFKNGIMDYISGDVEFGKIRAEDWEFPSDGIDPVEFGESIEQQGDRGVMYGNDVSYHQMCRFFSGAFYRHELVVSKDWYWRVEPGVEFYCDLTHVKAYVKNNNIMVKNAWDLLVSSSKKVINSDYPELYDDISGEEEIRDEISKNKKISQFLNKKGKTNEDVDNFDNELMDKLLSRSTMLPKLHEDRMDMEDYNRCHFWSNFEIARTDLFTSKEYQDFFTYLDSTGGFYKERWGDAPIHSLAVAMMLDINEIHYFRDIGYKHSDLVHCPANALGKQLPYEGIDEIFPDKPELDGVGCRCKCPTFKYVDREDSIDICFRKWVDRTSDNYRAFEPIDVNK
ncbi:KTR5 Probable mannosyltransferase KTR5 [Candida maltosa Xu316]